MPSGVPSMDLWRVVVSRLLVVGYVAVAEAAEILHLVLVVKLMRSSA